jgi:NADH-quinone oxidoreductase subunit H
LPYHLATLTICLFFGGFNNIFYDSILLFALKIGIVFFFFVWVRVTLPRYRYDQLMHIGWKNIIPITFGWFIFIVLFKYLNINYINYIDYLTFINVYDRI